MNKAIKSVALILLFSNMIIAQNAKEAIQNTKQIVEGKKKLERDTKELIAFKLKITAFNKAFDSKNSVKSEELKADILTDMIREVKQSEVKAKKARLEIAQSSAEIRSDRREIRDNHEDSKRGRFDRRDDKRDMARDQANKHDDKRDRRDDIVDFKAQIARAEQQVTVLKKLKTYNFSFENMESANANKKLISDFINSMEQDIVATKRELAEDNRERLEDSRERRDDRNERNEIETKRRRRKG